MGFATLVVVLPSNYTGGEVLIRHQDREVRFDPRCQDPSQVAFAAFYADCLHEVSPVISGCRLALIYNLLRQGPGDQPKPPSYEAEREQLTKLLRQWTEDEDRSDDRPPDKLILPLEHAYTQASLSFEALKGADAARGATLLAAPHEAHCELHLALLSIEESGSAEHSGAYRSYRRGRYDDEDEDEFEVVEVHDRSQTLSDWRRPDGGAPLTQTPSLSRRSLRSVNRQEPKRLPSHVCEPLASLICAPASPSPCRRPVIGYEPARSPALVVIAANSAGSSPIPRLRPGRSGLCRQTAVIWRTVFATVTTTSISRRFAVAVPIA